MSQYKPLKNLYFKFVEGTELDGILDWHHVADALNRHGLIVLVPDKTGHSFSGYSETKKLHAIAPHDFETTILEILNQYAKDQGL